MNDDDNLLQQIERVINEFGAELTVNRMILKTMVARLILITPMLAEETLENLRSEVISALKTPPASNEPEDKRVVELQIQHGERFFRELATNVSAMRNKLGQSGRH